MSLIKKLKHSRLNRLYKASILPRAQKKFNLLAPLIKPNARVIDIGCGNAGLAYLLYKNNINIKGFDIVNTSYFNAIETIVFNGTEIPEKSNEFDVALLITMLHHTSRAHQKLLLNEAKRVAKKVIVMEDIYTNYLGKKLTHFTDSLVNFEFKGHPHSNRTHGEWLKLFSNIGFSVESIIETKTLFYFKQRIYILISN